MRRDKYEPVVLTVAVTGGDVLPSQSPAIPVGASAIAEDAIRAAAAGATCVHLHARRPDGRPTGDADTFRAIVERIRAECDVVINITTGGSVEMSIDERLQGVSAVSPEIGTLNVASMSMEGFPDPARHPAVNTAWEQEVLSRAGTNVFVNTLAMVRGVAAAMRDLAVTPEVEAYDAGHIGLTRLLLDEGALETPLRMQLVLGVLGGADSSLETMIAMRDCIDRLIGLEHVELSVAAMGYPNQFRSAAAAMSLGLDFRVGMEDNLRVERKRLADSNVDHVAKALLMAQALDRPIKTPAELRAELGPWYRRRVSN